MGPTRLERKGRRRLGFGNCLECSGWLFWNCVMLISGIFCTLRFIVSL
ncbi:hypothetical protein Hanom_Chr14g01326351 [Helianthus anomalus]